MAYFPLLVLRMILSVPLILATAKRTSMKVGDTLYTSDPPLQSPSGDFSFGFHPVANGGSTYLPSIWYTNIPDTRVWLSAVGLVVPKGSKLVLTAGKGLVIQDPLGNDLLKSDSFSQDAIDHCTLNDNGNLIIWSTDGSILWQSFDHPRDTLLPPQTLNNNGPPVDSIRPPEFNFTGGRFRMQFKDGDLILVTRDPKTDTTFYDNNYYTSNTSGSGASLNFYKESGHMFILKNDISTAELTVSGDGNKVPAPSKDYYFRATLNFDGVFAWYYHKKTKEPIQGKSSWTMINWIPENICTSVNGNIDSGACGYNSICDLGADKRPTCQCPPSYSLVDPSDTYGDCKPNFELSAFIVDQKNNPYRFETLRSTNWPMMDYSKAENIQTEEHCKKLCSEDSFCAVAIFEYNNVCWKKKLPLSAGRTGGQEQGTVFLKVRQNLTQQICPTPPPIPIPDHHNNKGLTTVIYPIMLGTSAFLNMVLLCLSGLLYNRKLKRRVHNNNNNGRFKNSVMCFNYEELEEATNGFKEELGRGACGIVYKGGWGGGPDGSDSSSDTFIAVKKLDRASLGEAEKELKMEVDIIGQTHHKNLVKMIGFCEEGQHRMLVYEFMSNGSLADLLFKDLKPSWGLRINIATGVASGLCYLHEECTTQIIHCDIKPQNILLDRSYQPKISDFGLSKLLKLNQFQTQTMIRGTKGYVAPEWFSNKPIDVKVDVYSFGILLLEIISCRRCVSLYNLNHVGAVLADYAITCYKLGNLAAFASDDDPEVVQDMGLFERFLKTAIWCIQDVPTDRPTMRQVVQMLEGLLKVPAPPMPSSDSSSISLN